MKNISDSRLRKIRVWQPSGKSGEFINPLNDCNSSLIDLASNDYLGLSQNPELIHAAHKLMLTEGVGSGASRLVTGTRPIHPVSYTHLTLPTICSV